MMDAMMEMVARRLHDEAGIHATRPEIKEWSEEQCKSTALWMDALLRRKEGTPRAGDRYDFPEHVRVVVLREAGDVVASGRGRA